MFRGKDDNLQQLPECDDNAIIQTFFNSDDPLVDKIPCLIRGFMSSNHQFKPNCQHGSTSYFRCVITDETIVRVQHSSDVKEIRPSKRKNNKRQKDCLNSKRSTSSYRKLSSYDPGTVQSLVLRMSTILTNTVWIGADSRALGSRKKAQKNLVSMQNELNDFWDTQQSTDRTVSPSLMREGQYWCTMNTQHQERHP